MDSPGSLWIQIITILILTLINAIFAASELAFVSVNQTKMKQLSDEGNKSARRVLKLLENSDNFLATIQVAITLAGFLSSASAATSFANMLAAWLPNFPGVETVAIVIVTLILSYITLVFGELYPKQIALQMPEKIAMTTSGLVLGVQKISAPFVKLLSASTNLLQRMTPIEFSAEEDKFTRDEMKGILAESRKEGSIDLAEFTMLQGVLSLDTKLAREIMVPRTDTVMVDIEDDYADILAVLLSSPFSRVPLYESDKDDVIGVVHMKQLLKSARDHGFDNIALREIASEPLVVPSTMYIDDLLIEFRREQNHLAILKDEYGGMEGIVSLEDVLEEIVGEIEDETDVNTSSDVRKIDDLNYYVNGMLPIDKFNQLFSQNLENEEVDTVAGLVIYHIGYVPSEEERIRVRCNDLVLVTSHIENGRIRGLHLVVDDSHELETDYDFEVEEESAIEMALEQEKSDEDSEMNE